MNKRHHFKVLIFFIALLMILLRPYAAYSMVCKPGFAKDPVKTNSLLQRLVKKKDEHHALLNNTFTIIQQTKTDPVVPAARVSLIVARSEPVVKGISLGITNSAHIFKAYANNHYLLFARLQI